MLDVFGLLAHGDFGDAGQVDEEEVEDVLGVVADFDGLGGDGLVPAGDLLHFGLDAPAHVVGLEDFFAAPLLELEPAFFEAGHLVELYFDGTASDDALAAREELAADDGLEEGGLADALGAEDDDGGEVEFLGEACLAEYVVQIIYKGD